MDQPPAVCEPSRLLGPSGRSRGRWDGCYWTRANGAGLLLRFTPGGRLDRAIDLPVSKPSMCAFGGPRLDTLFVASIQPAVHAAVGEHDGYVLVLNPGVTGLPEPEFAGTL